MVQARIFVGSDSRPLGSAAAREYVRTCTEEQLKGEFATAEQRFPNLSKGMLMDVAEVCAIYHMCCCVPIRMFAR